METLGDKDLCPAVSVGGIFIASANLNGDTKPDIALNIGRAFP